MLVTFHRRDWTALRVALDIYHKAVEQLGKAAEKLDILVPEVAVATAGIEAVQKWLAEISTENLSMTACDLDFPSELSVVTLGALAYYDAKLVAVFDQQVKLFVDNDDTAHQRAVVASLRARLMGQVELDVLDGARLPAEISVESVPSRDASPARMGGDAQGVA